MFEAFLGDGISMFVYGCLVDESIRVGLSVFGSPKALCSNDDRETTLDIVQE